MPQAAVPANPDEQLAMASSHPMVLRRYIIPTPPLNHAAAIALEAATYRHSSCAFSGQPRFGKSSAIQVIVKDIRAALPGSHVIQLIGEQSNSTPNPRRFHDFVHESSGGVVGRQLSRQSALQMALRNWLTEIYSRSADHLVLVVDELQRFTVHELTFLADLLNKVADEQVRVTTLSFGTSEMVSLRSTLKIAQRGDLIGRFFFRMHRFRGISSVEELKSLLRALDDPAIAQFPRGSGWPFSKFFFPTAFENGWRLEHEAAAILAAFQRLAPRAPGKPEVEIGADSITLAIETALKKNMNFYIPAHPLSGEDLWKNSVAACGFSESLDM